MSTWGFVAVIVGALVVAVVVREALRGSEDRAARRELRRLRWKERDPDLRGAVDRRRNITMMARLPGRNTFPGGE